MSEQPRCRPTPSTFPKLHQKSRRVALGWTAGGGLASSHSRPHSNDRPRHNRWMSNCVTSSGSAAALPDSESLPFEIPYSSWPDALGEPFQGWEPVITCSEVFSKWLRSFFAEHGPHGYSPTRSSADVGAGCTTSVCGVFWDGSDWRDNDTCKILFL